MAPASSILITITSKANYQLPEIGYGYSSFGAPRLVASSFGSSSIRTVCTAVTSSGKPEYAVSSSLVSPSAFSRERTQVHTISVSGGDDEECGTLVNSIAGIFGRRRHNIDSLTVSGFINNHNGLFTIVLVFPATYTVFQQLVTHLNNLRNVFKVEDISTEPQVERELMLIKLHADHANKDEIMWLVKIFRAKVVDTSESYMTIEASGDPGKLAVILRNVKKIGIKEMARTGKIALRRESMGDCIFSASSCPSSSRSNRIRTHTMCMLVNDAAGVLSTITGIICSRGYNIQSVAVGQAEKEGLSRMTLVVPGTDESIGKLVQRLHNLIDVHEIEDVSHVPLVERELMLIKIATNTEARRDILDIANIFRAEAVDVSDHSITLQLTGDTDKMTAIQTLLEQYDIREVARTGRVALVRESSVNSTYLRG